MKKGISIVGLVLVGVGACVYLSLYFPFHRKRADLHRICRVQLGRDMSKQYQPHPTTGGGYDFTVPTGREIRLNRNVSIYLLAHGHHTLQMWERMGYRGYTFLKVNDRVLQGGGLCVGFVLSLPTTNIEEVTENDIIELATQHGLKEMQGKSDQSCDWQTRLRE